MWKKKLLAVEDAEVSIQSLARELGVERRQNVRVLYPPRITGLLPAIHYSGKPIRVHDISVGGCCLIDPQEILGHKIGNEIKLTLYWNDGSAQEVNSRIVARVDHRRHIQFSGLAANRIEELRNAMRPGTCGLSVRRSLTIQREGPALTAMEIWNSPASDSVSIWDVSEVHEKDKVIAEVHIEGAGFFLRKGAWPVGSDGKIILLNDLQGVILFLSNIVNPSASLQMLIHHLEDLSLGRLE